MKNIKLSESRHMEYVPVDGILCKRCKFNEECPYDYICRALDDLETFEVNGEL